MQFVTVKPEFSKKLSFRQIGKLIDHADGIGIVEYFDNPFAEREEIEVPLKQLFQADIPIGTRIYYYDRDADYWFLGRLKRPIDAKTFDVTFNPRNSPTNVGLLAPENFYVRHALPLRDPEKLLMQFITDRKEYCDKRYNYQNCMVKYRANSKGMGAIFSSIIELEAHQIEIATRVLQDPVQRYLLADEVGLGKTIEAGIILRQFVLDFPNDHNVLILVPNELQNQWEQELSSRFLLNEELEETINVVGFEDLESIEELISTANMIVIDEAHKLNKRDYPHLYSLAKENGRNLTRFLLLSGTPVLNNEAGFLEMLELLDPDVYQSENHDKFRIQIENRQRLAEIVSGLRPEEFLLMPKRLLELKTGFPTDKILEELVEDIMPKLNDWDLEQDDPEFLEKLASLTNYISEAYKLDRRVLRNRRANVEGLTPKRNGVIKIPCSSYDTEKMNEELEKFREDLSILCGKIENKREEEKLSAWFFVLVSEIFKGRLEKSIARDLFEEFEQLLSNSAGINSDTVQTFTDTLNKFLNYASVLDIDYRYQIISDFILAHPEHEKIIIFCSDPSIAGELFEFLDKNLIDIKCLYNQSPRLISSFLDSYSRTVVISDRTREEGLNLQGNNRTVIHFDLPLDPNRIEQRLGRVDRYGGNDFKCYLLDDESNRYLASWIEVIIKNVEVFDRSIASLQFVLENELKQVENEIITKGIDTFVDFGERLSGDRGLIQTELKRILEQENLDAIPKPLFDDFEKVEIFDQDMPFIINPIMEWLCDTLKIKNNIKGFQVLSKPGFKVLIKHQHNMRYLTDLRDFNAQFGKLKWAITRDKNINHLFEDFLKINDIKADAVSFGTQDNIFRALKNDVNNEDLFQATLVEEVDGDGSWTKVGMDAPLLLSGLSQSIIDGLTPETGMYVLPQQSSDKLDSRVKVYTLNGGEYGIPVSGKYAILRIDSNSVDVAVVSNKNYTKNGSRNFPLLDVRVERYAQLNMSLLTHLKDFNSECGVLKWAILHDKYANELFEDFLRKNKIEAQAISFDKPFKIFQALNKDVLNPTSVDVVVVSKENFRQKGSRNFNVLKYGVEGDEIFRFIKDQDCEIPLDHFVKYLGKAIDPKYNIKQTKTYASFECTFRRLTALQRHRENRPIRLIRPGETYFSGLNKITDGDDKGRSYATLRFADEYVSNDGEKINVFLSFEFLVEADVGMVSNRLQNELHFKAEESNSSLQRLGDSFLAPSIYKVWFDSNLEPVTDEGLRAILNKPFRQKPKNSKNGDLDFTTTWWNAAKLGDWPKLDEWEHFVSEGRLIAERSILTGSEIEKKLTLSFAKFKQDRKEKIDQLRTRVRNLGLSQGEFDIILRQKDLKREELISKHLGNGIKSPKKTCLGAGVIFLSRSMETLLGKA